VRAGLELVTAVRDLKTHETLQTRVGIATGLVVVGDLIGSGASQEQAIVGETPNLAARLQGIAEPNTAVIADGTRKLLGNLFELDDLGSRDLKLVWPIARQRLGIASSFGFAYPANCRSPSPNARATGSAGFERRSSTERGLFFASCPFGAGASQDAPGRHDLIDNGRIGIPSTILPDRTIGAQQNFQKALRC
jgi:hypothetical protein